MLSMYRDLCDNIGLVVGCTVCLLSGSAYVTASLSCHDTAIQDPYLVSCFGGGGMKIYKIYTVFVTDENTCMYNNVVKMEIIF